MFSLSFFLSIEFKIQGIKLLAELLKFSPIKPLLCAPIGDSFLSDVFSSATFFVSALGLRNGTGIRGFHSGLVQAGGYI